MIGRARTLYAIGGVGAVAALAGELAGADALAGVGYLLAFAGLLGGFVAERGKRG